MRQDLNFLAVKRKSGFTPKMLQKFSTEGILGFEDCFEKLGLDFPSNANHNYGSISI